MSASQPLESGSRQSSSISSSVGCDGFPKISPKSGFGMFGKRSLRNWGCIRTAARGEPAGSLVHPGEKAKAEPVKAMKAASILM
eukprot:CAMPEP_0183343256 /NCGR_PEP_ID=MMETSP0164_2-20130417/9211_1 /TAXON_ID=221442 /ORGANISM="Coccolithus pelagicus ssp braarudi, Strain PLY182g" /LENGTH=83 /DNA_ID=CAMNT_0025514035 /DNA_START=909 /DNA_END=1160 /DNA_ORIENTATION=+